MLVSAMVYLLAAVIAVPVANRLGLGSVLGYLLAGIIIGPYALHVVGDQTEVMHYAEFGVVMMLFLVGLELRPSRLWEMRRPILGLGGLQVVFTAALIATALITFANLVWQVAVAIGLTLALSSTAIVLQSLTERGLIKTQAGNNAFAVLLFQDIAVIPILAILPLLAVGDAVISVDAHSNNLISDLPGWGKVAVMASTMALIIAAGRFLLAPFFHIIASTKIRELFTAGSLLLIIGIAVLMQSVGLSPALGAFLAGVVLADSEFRHELEVDIEPFKGLLLGLFFITVGASVNIPLLLEKPLLIAALVIALVGIKLLVLLLLATAFKMTFRHSLLFSIALAQGGEFAFVLVSVGGQFSVFSNAIASTVILVVALSMLISPLLLVAYEGFYSRAKQRAGNKDREADSFDESADVIIAGYGRFGQIIGRLLTAQGFKLTILDHSPSQVELVRRFGHRVFYGDASRRDLLEAAGASDAKILVIAVDESDRSLAIINTAQKHFPHLKILCRAFDRRHAYELMKKNIAGFRRETFDSALYLGVNSLELLGLNKSDAKRAGQLFSEHDEQTLGLLADLWGDEKSYGMAVKQRVEDLKRVLAADQNKGPDGEGREG